jgi:hypothetical protein
MHNVCLCTSAAIGHHLTASVAFANAQQQQPVSAADDDRFPQPAGAELTIELATREAPAGWPLDERLATLAIARAPAANPQNVGSRSPPAEAVSALLFAKGGSVRGAASGASAGMTFVLVAPTRVTVRPGIRGVRLVGGSGRVCCPVAWCARARVL